MKKGKRISHHGHGWRELKNLPLMICGAMVPALYSELKKTNFKTFDFEVLGESIMGIILGGLFLWALLSVVHRSSTVTVFENGLKIGRDFVSWGDVKSVHQSETGCNITTLKQTFFFPREIQKFDRCVDQMSRAIAQGRTPSQHAS